jgi:hypothetical protein
MLKMKYLWTLALVALCVSMASGLALAAPPPSWSVADSDLPDNLAAGDTYDGYVTAENNGTTEWDDTYSLDEVMGTTATAVAIERWGVAQVFIADVTVPTSDDPDTEDVVENQYEFDFTVVAPPWVTLAYDTTVTATSVPVISTFEDNYIMNDGSGFMTQDIALADTSVQNPSFSDIDGDFWAWGEIQECANAASASSGAIVHGYGDGSYQPLFEVTRAMMAVFLANAMGLTDDPPVDIDGNPVPTFPVDVPPTYWSYTQIEQCVLNGVVKGYGDFYGPGIPAYLPGNTVNRDQMAVFLIRAAAIPTDMYLGGFSDIVDEDSDGWWARDEIQAASDAHIALGYLAGDGSTEFKPSRPVLRDQMAVFIWRALVMNGNCIGDPTRADANVVIAGPAVTTFAEVDPGVENLAELFMPTDVAGLSYLGWTVPVNDDGDPIIIGGSIVYVGLDAVHVASGDIVFTVSHVETIDDEDVTVVDDTSNALTIDSDAARADVNTSGTPYLIASYMVPTIAAGTDDVDYTVTVTLPNGAELEVGTFTVTGTG